MLKSFTASEIADIKRKWNRLVRKGIPMPDKLIFQCPETGEIDWQKKLSHVRALMRTI